MIDSTSPKGDKKIADVASEVHDVCHHTQGDAETSGGLECKKEGGFGQAGVSFLLIPLSLVANGNDGVEIVSVLGRSTKWEIKNVDVIVVTPGSATIAWSEKCRVVVFFLSFSSAQNTTVHAATVLAAVTHHAIPIHKTGPICGSEYKIKVGEVS